MLNVKRQAVLVLLALVGVAVTLTDVNAFGRKCRTVQPQIQEEYVVHEAAVLPTVISGKVYDIDGTELKSPDGGAPATVTILNSADTVITSATNTNSSDATYSVTSGTPLADNIIKVVFRQKNGTGSVTYIVSFLQTNHRIHPVIPR